MNLLSLSLLFWLSHTFGATTPLPNVPLVNQTGKPFQLHDLKGKYVFVSFVYTRCPLIKMCPLTMTLSRELFLQAKKQRATDSLHFLFVTLDPQNDTPKVLSGFAKAHHLDDKPNVSFATGAPKAISDLASGFNVIGVPSEGMISHNSKSALLDPDLTPIKEYKDNEWKPGEVLNDLLTSKAQTPASTVP